MIQADLTVVAYGLIVLCTAVALAKATKHLSSTIKDLRALRSYLREGPREYHLILRTHDQRPMSEDELNRMRAKKIFFKCMIPIGNGALQYVFEEWN